jgi:exonuclease III
MVSPWYPSANVLPPRYHSARYLQVGKEYSSDAIGDGPGGEDKEEERDLYFGNFDDIDDNEFESDEDENNEDYEVEDQPEVDGQLFCTHPASDEFECIKELIPNPDEDWTYGDNMALKCKHEFRVATLNVGKTMSKDDWEERAKDIVNLMLAYDIQVLCLQELHIFKDSKLEKYLTKAFGDLHHRIIMETIYQPSKKKGKKYNSIKTSTGVGIVTSQAYHASTDFCKREGDGNNAGRNISLLVPIMNLAERAGTRDLDIDRCAIQTVYGYSGFSTRASLNEETRNKLSTQSRQMEAMHEWATRRDEVSCSIICGDFNLIDNEELDVEGGQVGKRIAEGMLAIALDKLGYEDAVRMRVGQEIPIFTHTRTTRICTSSYLDRILVRGAKVTRAGILAPAGQFKGLIDCDHCSGYR